MGLGAGLVGALFLALRYAVRPAAKGRLPDSISPAIFRTKVLHTSLGEVVYHESGSGPALVFIHGVGPGASSYEWSKVYPEFTSTHRVIAPDLIGFGESSRPDSNLTAADYARSLAEFIRAKCDEPPAIIASGLGAGFSVLLASQHPELVKRLLLWMPTGLTETGAPRPSLGTRLASSLPVLHRFLYRNYESTRMAMRAWLTEFGFADPSRITDEMVDVYTNCAQQYGAEHAVRNLYAGRLNIDLEARLRTLSQPVTLLWTDSSPTSPPEMGMRLQALVPGAELFSLTKLSQLGAVEGAAEMTAVLREELEPGPKLVK